MNAELVQSITIFVLAVGLLLNAYGLYRHLRRPPATTWGDTYVPGTTQTINEYRRERGLPPLA